MRVLLLISLFFSSCAAYQAPKIHKDYCFTAEGLHGPRCYKDLETCQRKEDSFTDSVPWARIEGCELVATRR